MLDFVIRETTVREAGESAVFHLSKYSDNTLLLTLGITHAMQQETLDLEIFTSGDGEAWSKTPVVSFRQKSYCGTYHVSLPRSGAKFLKAAWQLSRWRHTEGLPLFRFYLAAEPARAMAGAA